MHLDGEIWAGRGRFAAPCYAVLYNRWSADVVFMVFDAPEAAGDWRARMQVVARSVRCRFAHAVPWRQLDTLEEVGGFLAAVTAGGGEALMARRPGVEGYRSGRSDDVVKILRDPITGAPVIRPRRHWRRARQRLAA